MSELQGLQLSLEAISERDCQILAVVVDPVEQNRKVVASLDLGFRVLADPGLEAIDAFGLRHRDGPEGDMARPASFLIDREGVIRWRDLTENYRIRPRPATILEELDRLGS